MTIIKDPVEFTGWHLVFATFHSRGIYNIALSKRDGNGARMIHTWSTQDALRVARETDVIKKSNGYMLPD